MAEQYRNDDDYRRGSRREWTDRASDEVRSWFGDDDAQARRRFDEREDRYRSNPRERSWRSQGELEYMDRPSRFRDDERDPGHEFLGEAHGRGSRGEFEHLGRRDERDWRTYRDRYESRPWDQRPSSDPGRAYREGADRFARYGRPAGESGRSSDGFDRWGGQGNEYRGARSSSTHGNPEWRGPGDYGWGGRTDSSWGHDSDRGGLAYYESEDIGWRGRSSEGRTSQPFGRESFAGRGPKGYQRSDDRIREEISDRLTADHAVDASEISIDVRAGAVTLTGTVQGRDQKRRAEDIAEEVMGVNEVTNNLRVARQDSLRPFSTDTSISGRTSEPSSGLKTGKNSSGVSA